MVDPLAGGRGGEPPRLPNGQITLRGLDQADRAADLVHDGRNQFVSVPLGDDVPAE
jgi:hypothetical protein